MQLPPIRIILDAGGAKELCKELEQQPVVAVDSEWHSFSLSRHQVHNGLSLCWTFCYRDLCGDLQLIYLHNFGDQSEANIWALKDWWTSPNHIKVLHNAPVDWHILANHGIIGKGFRYDTMVMDFLLDENRQYRHGLKECANDHLKHYRKDYGETFGSPMLKVNGQPYATGRLEVPPLEDVVSDRSLPRELCGDEEGMPPDVLVEYACEDAYDTFLLYEFYKKKLMATPWIAGKTYWNYYDEVESLITEIITGIERRGMALDMPFLSEMKECAEKQLEETEAEIIRFVGVPINIKSSKQRGHLLHGRGVMPIHRGKTLLYEIKGMGLPVMDTTQTGQPKVDAGTMRKLQRWAKKNRPTIVKFIDLMNLHSSIKTQLGTFLTGLKEKQIHGRIHTRINQIGVPTGRFSSSGPNLQNITTGEKDRFYLRHCFCASEGNILLDADYGQLEYRLLAHFTQDPALLKAFREGLDLHSLSTFNIYLPIQAAVKKNFGSDDVNKDVLDWIAREFPDERKRGKTLNFEIIYGVGPHKLADQLEITLAEGKRMIEAWFFGYNHVRPWMRRELQKARSRGFIRTLMGRYRRTVPSRLSSHERRIRGREERILINAKIQGSAADVCERAMILIDQSEKLKELGVQMIMQIHDEILCECPADVSEEAALVKKEIMENPFSKPLRVPLPVDVGIGPTWASAKV